MDVRIASAFSQIRRSLIELGSNSLPFISMDHTILESLCAVAMIAFPELFDSFSALLSMHKPIAAGLVPIPNHPEHQLHKGRPELLRSTLGDLPVMHCLIRALHPWHQPRIRRILRIAHKPPNIVRSSWTSLSSLTFLAICCSAS